MTKEIDFEELAQMSPEDAAKQYDKLSFGPPAWGEKVMIDELKHSEWITEAFKAGIEYQKAKAVMEPKATGLKDKNGKEIMEGDIIKSRGGMTIYVAWEEEHGRFIYKNDTGFTAIFSGGDSVEVIGTISEHRHLLKQPA